MKEKIEEVQSYFKNKLMSRDFTAKKTEDYTLKIEIDGYEFRISTGLMQFGAIGIFGFMDINLSDEEQKELIEYIKPIVNELEREKLLKKKAELKERIEKLVNINN
jgi:hypothetical protein